MTIGKSKIILGKSQDGQIRARIKVLEGLLKRSGNLLGVDAGLGNTTVDGWTDKHLDKSKPLVERFLRHHKIVERFLRHHKINEDWWETGKGEVLNAKPTPVDKATDNNEKADPSINEAIRNLLEGNTDYILIHKVVILEKYRLQSIEQAEKDKQELRDREKQISELHEIIKLMVTTGKQPDTVKTLEVKEGK